MNYIPHIINEKTITAIIDGEAKVVSSSHRNFAKIKKALITGDFDSVPNLIDEGNALVGIGGGDIQVVGGVVKYQGRDIPNYQAQKLLSMLRDGRKDIEPFKNFICRLMENPSARAREEFARFMDFAELPFDSEGFVYAYKGLNSDYWSVRGNKNTRVLKGKVNEQGQIYNGLGEEIEVDRRDVDDDPSHYCSQGIHLGSHLYATDWSRGKVVLCKFDPKDVVSVPLDCQGQKVRVCHYWVVSDFVNDKPIDKPVISKEGKLVETSKKTYGKNYNRGHYYTKFYWFVKNNGLNINDRDIVLDEMVEDGFTNEVIINELFDKFILAEKISRYIKNKLRASPRDIQKRFKSEQLSIEQIVEIEDKFLDLI